MKCWNIKTYILIFMTALVFLTGCGQKIPQTGYRMCFDTIVSITIYDDKYTDLLNDLLSECDKYELIFSKTNPNSELYKLNTSISNGCNSIQISPILYDAISIGKHYSYDNALNIGLGSTISLWDFKSDSKNIPDDSLIKEALLHTDISSISLSDDYTISSTDSKLSIDLGAIAKGYIGNELRKSIISSGCENAIVSLAGNVILIGDNYGKGYEVGIQKPFGKQGELITTVHASNTCVVTSGIYERCFTKNDKLYHHIIDPQTGYPVDNELSSVTIICEDSLKADILSTYVLALGKEKGTKYLSSQKDVSAILITKDNEIFEINR